ncbi:hypothetical protein ACHAXS_006541 [Conticribra weissflogii]
MIPKHHAKANNSYANIIQTNHARQNVSRSATTWQTYYGPGELEMYRHQQLHQSVKDAKLKVFYPGQWGRPSPRACFRIPVVYDCSKEALSIPDNNDDYHFAFTAGESGMIVIQSNSNSSDEVYVIRFRSNARIISACWTEFTNSHVENESDDCMKIHQGTLYKVYSIRLGWKSTVNTAQGDRVYDHFLLIPPDNVYNFNSDKSHLGGTAMSFLEVELDSRHQEPLGLAESDGKATKETLEACGCDKDKEEYIGKTWEGEILEDGTVDEVLALPPCITFEVFFPSRGDRVAQNNSIGSATIPSKKNFHWKRHTHDAVSATSWTWRKVNDVRRGVRSDAKEINRHPTYDWLSISNFWAIENNRRHSIDVSAGEAVDCWKFPHQMELSTIATVHPVSVEHLCQSPDENANISGNQYNSRLYDFGKETFGKVVISVPASSCSSSLDKSSFLPLIPRVKLWVGESLAEALNEKEEYFEQSLDLLYSFESNDPPCTIGTTINDSFQKSLRSCWKSAHLLAFRYVRVLIEYDTYENVDLSRNLTHTSPDSRRYSCNNPTVYCESYMPHLELRGSFQCSGSRINKIWNCATQTLQLCTHHNFLVDGIKRDRLPWAGDLAVSLLANAYTFRDPCSIEWSLTILGRCGMDHIANDSLLNHMDVGCSVADERKIMSASHVNGIVDYSMWFVICHSLYQQHFGNTSFLRQEWKWIESRMKSLIATCSNREEGWFLFNEDDWLFIDWTDDVKKSSALQVLWWWALDCAISLARKMKSIAHIDSLEDFTSVMIDLQSRLMTSYLAQSDIQGHFSRHAHILGLISGLYSRLEDVASDCDWNDPNIGDERSVALRQCRQLHQKSKDLLLSDELCAVGTPYMKTLECLALSRVGERMLALERLERYWYGMIRCGATTFYEAFNENESPDDVMRFYNRPFARSLCHAWGAGPSSCLTEICFGLRPLSDGWRVWSCDPLTSISSGSTALETDHGKIVVEIDSTEIRISVPPGTEMILMDTLHNSGDYCIPRKKLISAENIQVWSKKYRGWHYDVHPNHIIPPNPEIVAYEGKNITMTDVPTIFQVPGNNDLFYMSFVGFDGDGYQSFIAESSDLLVWNNIRLAMSYGEEGSFDHGGVVLGAYLYESYDIAAPRVLKRVGGKFFSLYGAYAKKGTYEPDPGFQGLASSEDGLVWKCEIDESILSIFSPGVVGKWEKDR